VSCIFSARPAKVKTYYSPTNRFCSGRLLRRAAFSNGHTRAPTKQNQFRNSNYSNSIFLWDLPPKKPPTNCFLVAVIYSLIATDWLAITDKFSLLQIEELRGLRGTLGLPGTVAPFRAWRGSRDLVARSPKFHDSAVGTSRLLLKS
jgi:hypothetical protein